MDAFDDVGRSASQPVSVSKLELSCEAWMIADLDSSTVLSSSNPYKPMQIASITKVMTAHIVLRECTKKPQLLNEVVIISSRAGAIGGTTADVRRKEKWLVIELLYAMLLPSGNDAATALAEHFGPRFAPNPKGGRPVPSHGPHYDFRIGIKKWSRLDPIARFVAEMNRTSDAIGLRFSFFVNPCGLQHDEHYSCVVDVCRMTLVTFRKFPLFGKISACREYKTSTLSPSTGVARKVLWLNTNRLLESERFECFGFKTGITNAAGGCLVSAVRTYSTVRRQFVVVTLGSTDQNKRFTDTEALIEWAEKLY